MTRFLFCLLAFVGRPFGGFWPRRIVHKLAQKAYGDLTPSRAEFHWHRDKFGNQLLLHPHYFIDYQIIAFGSFDKALESLLRGVVRPGMTCLDIGANIGCVTLPMAKLVGATGKVFSFEPVPHLFQRLQENVSRNSFGKIASLHQLALSNETGSAQFRMAPADFGNQGMASLKKTDHPSLSTPIQVVTERLDDFARRVNLTAVDLIKIDAEGAEMWILQGGMEMLARCSPALVFEVNPYNLRGFNTTGRDLIASVESLGYECYHVGKKGQIGRRLRAAELTADYGADEVFCCSRKNTRHPVLLPQKH